ncbi:MAG: GtrA family protein [Clostridiales bacterium]|nr:GtrA family protein [Clostridiales bacterium]
MFRKLWSKFVNRETIAYLITGVMTTLVDWVSYALLRHANVDYRVATVASWAIAVLFAYVTNKFFVFRSMSVNPGLLWKEFTAFVACRLVTGIFTLIAMMVMVDGLGIKQDFICKVVVSAISLVLNYLFSKWFIFKKKGDRV